MLNVNTIEFSGEKAVINSFSNHPALIEDMNRQREDWIARFPNATVRTEQMSEIDTMALVAAGNTKRPSDYCGHYSHCWTIGAASQH